MRRSRALPTFQSLDKSASPLKDLVSVVGKTGT